MFTHEKPSAGSSPAENGSDSAGNTTEDSRNENKRAPAVKKRRLTYSRVRKQLRISLVLFVILLAGACFSAYHHYNTYPGRITRSSIQVNDSGLDYIVIKWDSARNAESYRLLFRPKGKVGHRSEKTWTVIRTTRRIVKVKGLDEGTTYSFAVCADSKEHEGHRSGMRNFATQRKQKLKVDENLVKLTSSKPFKIDTGAKTAVTYESGDTDIADIDASSGKIHIKGSGRTEIRISAEETDEYTSASATIDLLVLDAEPSDIAGYGAREMYHVSPDNCELVMYVAGEGGADVPQGFAYTGDSYLVTFGMYGPTRIVKYDTEGNNREVEVPDISLGHPNGFTYSPDSGLCYCVRGNSSACVIYDTVNDSYSQISMPVGCSGIAYDKVTKRLCTSARKSLVVYDSDDLSIIRRTGVISHSGTIYRQDCECYGGLLLHCLSGSGKHGINYIDVYDMEHGKYIGTITCDLSEVESAIVNDDGFLEILSNGSGSEDCIWRTDINIAKLAEEF